MTTRPFSDDGLQFHAVLKKPDGSQITRESDNRREFLVWLWDRQADGDDLIEIGTTARGPALNKFVAALTYGAARLLEQEGQEQP